MLRGFALRGVERMVLAAFLASGCWMTSASASAQQSVVLLSLVSEDGDDGLAAELSDAVYTEAAQVREWDLSSNRPSLMQMTMANDCEITNGACRATIGGALGAQHVVYGTLRRGTADAVGVELLMFDSAGGEIVASATSQMAGSDRGALPRVAAELLRDLRGLAPESEPAPILADDEPEERTDAALAARVVDDEMASGRDDYSSGGSNDWLGYTLLGVAGVSIGGAVFSWMQIDDASTDVNYEAYRREVGRNDPTVTDVCAEAERGETHGLSQAIVAEVRDQCDRGSTFETLQYVFLGAFAVSGGVGLYFLLDDEGDGDSASSDTPRLAIEPRFGPHGTAINARLTF